MSDASRELTYRRWDGTTASLGRRPVMDAGVIPVPRGRWEGFWHHWHHGRLMGFPRLSVALFCVRSLWGYQWWFDQNSRGWSLYVTAAPDPEDAA